MSWSTPDLSDVTQVLKGLVENALNQSALPVGNIKVYCDSPDTARQTDGFCHLNLYLLHVGRDPYWHNTPVKGPRPQLNSAQPLSLNLSYLLTAWSDKDFVSEQRAMTIALQTIHKLPIVTNNTIQLNMLQQWMPEGEFVMSIEADTIEEMSRLWQAFTVPIRLSALIKVGIVFVDAALPIAPPSIAPSTVNLTVAPETVPATNALLLPGSTQSTPPVAPDALPTQITAQFGPLAGVGGSTIVIAGNGLDLAIASEIFLSPLSGGSEWTITGWRSGTTSAGETTLLLPAAYADPSTSLPAPPAATPVPGLYSLAVGQGTARSDTIPIMIAPRIDGVVNPPVLAPDSAGIYTINGAGFVAAATAVSFGATPLTSAAGSPGPGEFSVNAAGTTINLQAPAAVSAGSYPLQISVSNCPASTGWVVVLT
jgi:hypothetical protein